MTSKYDLVIVGAGPAGLTAAKTASDYGLSVALIERKKNIPKITRACGMMIISLSGPYLGERVVLNPEAKKICFPVNGFSLPYDGPHRDYYSWQFYSYGGSVLQLGDYESNKRKGEKARASATYDKSTLLNGLLRHAQANGAKVFPSTNIVSGRKTREGALVESSDGRTFEGRYVIAADGRNSRIARSLGVNRQRTFYGTVVSAGYVMADIDVPHDDVFYTIFMDEKPPMRFYIIPKATDPTQYNVFISVMNPMGDYWGAMERFTKEGRYASWFKHARIVEIRGTCGNMISPVTEPFHENFIFAGDAGWFQEAEMTGAAMCGWKAAGCVAMAVTEGETGKEPIQPYIDWWRRQYADQYDFTQMARGAAMNAFLTTEDMNFLFANIEEALPNCMDPYEVRTLLGQAIAKIMPVIQKRRPELITKLQRGSTLSLQELLEGTYRAGFPCKN